MKPDAAVRFLRDVTPQSIAPYFMQKTFYPTIKAKRLLLHSDGRDHTQSSWILRWLFCGRRFRYGEQAARNKRSDRLIQTSPIKLIRLPIKSLLVFRLLWRKRSRGERCEREKEEGEQLKHSMTQFCKRLSQSINKVLLIRGKSAFCLNLQSFAAVQSTVTL